MRYAALTTRLSVTLLGVALLASCSDANDPVALVPDAPSMASSGPVLVECPVDYEISVTGKLGATGGSIQLGKHAMTLPALAITAPREFKVAAPASNYMELALHPKEGGNFQFNRPVSVTIDYSRCSRSNIDKAPLTVWYIDPATKGLLQNMGGVDDKENRTITFTTDHLSTFSIAQ